jgi:tetratricopeptide (TPR) repeat protein
MRRLICQQFWMNCWFGRGECGNRATQVGQIMTFSQDADEVLSPKLMEMMARAQRAFMSGRLGEAEFNCRLVLGAHKNEFAALHLLGLIQFQHGKFEEANRLIRQALRVNPRSAKANSNLALALQQLNRLDDALASLDRALALEPDFLLALNNRGHVLWRLKRSEEALESLDRALALKPDYVDALCNRGNALVELQRLEEALASYDEALAISPKDAPALNNRANVLWGLERRDEAMQDYDRALALAPDDLSILKDRGSALADLHRNEEALACFDRALELKPDDPYFLFKRGGALAQLKRHEEALDCFDRAFAMDPGDIDALGNRGNALSALQRHAEAIASYDQALAINPESPTTHWNRGCTLLRIGDYEQGWKEYEWRFKLKTSPVPLPGFPQPRWFGDQPIEGKTVLLYWEQGFGETIQFVRYVPLLTARGAKVILRVQPELKNLLAGDDAVTVISTNEDLPPFDLHSPLMSLPLAFKTRLDTIPAKTPYLFATQERLNAWRERLPQSSLPRVAIGWAGNPNFPGDRSRSPGLPPLLPLLSVPGVQFISLQKDLRAGDEELLHQCPQVIHLGDQLEDFSDTAAIMSLVDLVICSDTAPVHLAGALGEPVWVLLERSPDWRWMFERTDNPWYPTARLFRQPSEGDWDGVIKQVVMALQNQQVRKVS